MVDNNHFFFYKVFSMSVNPLQSTQNAAWAKSKGYGYKMLIKMGWKPGEGVHFWCYRLTFISEYSFINILF